MTIPTPDTLVNEVQRDLYRGAVADDIDQLDNELSKDMFKALQAAGGGGGGGGGGDATMGTTFTVSNAVGTYEIGDTVHATDKIATVVKNMLSYVTPPTWTAPSASLTLSPSTTLYEVGSSVNVTATIGFSRGTITNGDGTTGNRAGAATGYTITRGSQTSAEQASNSFTLSGITSNTTIKGTVKYAAGDQPVDSTGAPYGDPLPAGSLTTAQKTISFVLAAWANTANIGTVAKLPLQTSGTFEFSFPTAPAATPEIFDVPSAWTVTAIQVRNDLSGAWENASSQFDVSTTTHNDAAGNSVTYKRYTSNIGDVGARRIRITCTGM